MVKAVKEEKTKMESRFSKEAVLLSRKYGTYGDVLSAVLEDGGTYTSKEVDNMIEKFQKGKVK